MQPAAAAAAHNVLQMHKNVEYISDKTILTILREVFPSHEVSHNYSSTHFVIKSTITDFMSAPIYNWKFNRPPDFTRCTEIAQYYKTKPMETTFYLTFNPKKECFDILDGIHRYTALKIIHKTSEVDYISGNIIGPPVFLNIRFNATYGELADFFQFLNKANPVPDLYTQENNANDKRIVIETLAVKWQKNYPEIFSSSAKPNKPNVNRDQFIGVLDAVWDKHNLTQEPKERLEQLVEEAHQRIQQLVPLPKLTNGMMDKCRKTGCWLFAMRLDELEDFI